MFSLLNLQSLLGLVVIVAACWGLSENRKVFPWRLTLGAIAVQAVLIFVTFAVPGSQVVLDGIILPRNFDLDLLPPPKQIAGIEVYTGAATIPPQFGGPDRRCGVVAVWTRDGY